MKYLNTLMIGATLAFTAITTASAFDVTDNDGVILDAVMPEDAYGEVSTSEDAFILDVRTDAEFIWVGHPGVENIANVSIKIEKKGKMILNPSFISDMDEIFGDAKDSRIIIICRSGDRSRGAAKKLISNGYTNISYVYDGFEGSKDYVGTAYRTTYGWKNTGELVVAEDGSIIEDTRLPVAASKVGDGSYYAD